jgi:DNA-binding response OmpR family regulator
VRLRRYIEDDPANPRHLLTARGVGYRVVADPQP